MTTHQEILDFVKRQRRIPSADTQYDAAITETINQSYRTYCRRFQNLYSPALRDTEAITLVDGQQDYNLPANFDRLIDNSVRYYDASGSQQVSQILPIVTGPDAEIWESMQETYAPGACRVIAGSTGTQRKLRLLPSFSQTGYTVDIAYWIRPATLAGGATLEVPELADAVAWDCVAMSYDYFRDVNGSNGQASALARAREAYKQAQGTLQN